jgi:hypothetical protein
MSKPRIERPKFTQDYVGIGVLAEQLHLPLKTLLYLASDGHVPLFALSKPRAVMYVSVHEDLIAPHAANLPKAIGELARRSTIGFTDLGAEGVLGFFLSQRDCHELLHQRRIKQCLFPAVARKRFDQISAVPPNPGFFPLDRISGLSIEGWRVGCYPADAQFAFKDGSGYPPPLSLDINVNSIYARPEEVEKLLNIIDSDEILRDALNEKDVVDERPACFSAKLQHLIDISERFWRTNPAGAKDYDVVRKSVWKALQDPEFHSYFDKPGAAEGVLMAASRFMEPAYASGEADENREEVDDWYLAPKLRSLMAASKLFWASPHVRLDEVATHPGRAEMEIYLRMRGIFGNDAKYAMTIIRPPEAAYGRPIPESSTASRILATRKMR